MLMSSIPQTKPLGDKIKHLHLPCPHLLVTSAPSCLPTFWLFLQNIKIQSHWVGFFISNNSN